MSWKLGYGRGKAGRPYTCPWWVDRTVYALAFMQGKGVEIPKPQPSADAPADASPDPLQ